jgi:hypothetical protein
MANDDFMERFRIIKFRAAVEALRDYTPDGWKWELTLWQDGSGENIKINPMGEYKEKRPPIPIKATVVKPVKES